MLPQVEPLSIDKLAALHAHAQALLSSGVLNGQERSHVVDVRDRLEVAIKRQREREDRSG
jgi:hypothetical protein